MNRELDKLMLHSLEAEQAILGTLLQQCDLMEKIESVICTQDFHQGVHQIIFAEMVRQANHPSHHFDIITIFQALKEVNQIDQAGGQSYLAGLVIDNVHSTNLVAYANILREKSILRQLAATGREITGSCYQTEGRTPQEILEASEAAILSISNQNKVADEEVLLQTALHKTADLIESLTKSKGCITGAETGWIDFDKMTSGLHKGDMIVVAGRPSMGKTAFALNMVERVAKSTQKTCLVFSAEMTAQQLIFRMIASQGSIDQNDLRSGRIENDNARKLVTGVSLLNQLKIVFNERRSLTPSELRASARRVQRQHGELGMIMIDYLQLMSAPGHGVMRANEIAEISRSIKMLAGELNVPIVVLSQLNRSLEQRPDKRPMMSDLRESGAIEQDADTICFIYRDEVYNKESTDAGIAEIIIGKQRNGPIGTVKLAFQSNYSRFMNLSQDLYDLYG